MSKKKIIGISASVIVLIALIIAGVYGITIHKRHQNVVETGNILGVSWYNETDREFTITTVEELYEFAALSDFYDFKDQTVYLGADIIINEGNATDWSEKAPDNKWTPIKGFAGTFDGQGHTISGLYGKGFECQMAMFTDAVYSCTIKDFSLVNSYFETIGYRGVASIMAGGGGKLYKIYSDAILHHDGENVAGIASMIEKQSVLEECWFDGSITTTLRDCGGIIDEINGARVSMKHCLFSGTIYSSYDYGGTRTGGMIGFLQKGATVIIEDCLSSGEITCDKNVYTGSVLGSGATGATVTVTDSYVSENVYTTIIGKSGTKGTLTGSFMQMPLDFLTGIKAYQWTTLNFDEYWAVVEDGTPILKCFADTVPSLEGVAKVYDISWYTPGSYEYTISTREQLYGLTILAAGTDFSERIVKLGADIVVNDGKASDWAKEAPELPWIPIASFAGTFDGQGHSISGLYINSQGDYLGLFKKATGTSIIKNVKILNSYMEHCSTTDAYMGSVAAETYGLIENVYSDAILVSEGNQVGGIVGRANDNDATKGVLVGEEDYSVIRNCWFDGSVTMLGQGEPAKGAIIGGGLIGLVVQGDCIVEHCLNTGTVKCTTTGTAVQIGGLIGGVWGAATLELKDSLNTGLIESDHKVCVGSVIGRLKTEGRIVNVTNTYATEESYSVAISTNANKGTVNGGVIRLAESWLTGYKGYQFTNLDFANYWAVQVGPDGTPILSTFANKKPSLNNVAKLMDTSWYKEDAKEMVIDSLADLYGFTFLSATTDFKGQTVKLGADIALNAVDKATLAAWANGTKVPENTWLAIGSSSKKFAGTFDGQGHTISGVYLTSEEQYVGFFSATAPESTIKNFKLVDSYIAYNGSNLTEEGKEATVILGGVVGEARGNVDSVYSNAIVVSTANQVGGIVGRAYNKTEEGMFINNCWFDGQVRLIGETARYAGGIVGVTVAGTTVDITNCLNSGSVSNERDNGGQHIGGILGTDYGVCTVNISDCLNTGSVTAAYYNCVGSVIGRTAKAGSIFTITNTYTTNESCVNADGTVKTIGSASSAGYSGGVTAYDESRISGYKGYQFTTLDFDKYWAVQVNPDETPILATFATSKPSLANVERLIDTSWYSEDAKEMVIDSLADLYGFAILSTTKTFKGQTIKLGADIVVNAADEATVAAWADGTAVPDNTWMPIGSSSKKFAGTFDGQGHTISGVYLASSDTYIGFFSATDTTSTVKNFRLVDSYFTYTGNNETEATVILGGVIGESRGNVDSVYSNAVVVSTANQVGGIVGRAYNKTDEGMFINNCWFDGEVKLVGETARYAGGIVGVTVAGTILDITNCHNSGSVSNERPDGGQHIGGILGTDFGVSTVNISGCLNTGSVTAVYYNCVGSVIGRTAKEGSVFTVTNTYTTNESCVNLDGTVKTVGSTSSAGYTGQITAMSASNYEGFAGYTLTSLDFDTIWAARADKSPALQTFVGKGLDLSTAARPDTEWFSNPDEDGNYHITNVNELYGFAQLVNGGNTFEGKVVYLDNDIEVNVIEDGVIDDWKSGGTKNVVNKWEPISSNSATFRGTFDGDPDKDGELSKISGIYMDTTAAYSGLFGITHPLSTLKNFELLDSYFAYSGDSKDANDAEIIAVIGSVCGDMRGDIDTVHSNAIVKSTANRVGGLVAIANGAAYNGSKTTSSITNCWFDGDVILTGDVARYAGGIAAIAMQGTIEITNTLYTGNLTYERQSGDMYIGGILGTDWAGSTVVRITDTLSAGTIQAVTADVNDPNTNYSVVRSVLACIRNTSTTYTFTNVYATNEACVNANGDALHSPKVVSGLVAGSSYAVKGLPKAQLSGVYGYKNTLLDFDTYWAARADEVPALLSFVNAGLDLSGVVRSNKDWYNSPDASGNYHIGTLAELYGLAELVNDSATSFSGKTIYLEKDIEVNEVVKTDEKDTIADWKAGKVGEINLWNPIGNATNKFDGTFDGKGNTISGIYIKTSEQYLGVFGYIEGATIQNLRLEDSYFENTNVGGYAYLGTIAGVGYGELRNLYSNADIYSKGSRVAGIIGYAGIANTSSTTNLVSCWYDGEIVIDSTKTAESGGLVGYARYGTVVIDTCLCTGILDFTYTSPTSTTIQGTFHTSFGGLVGTNNASCSTAIRNSMAVVDMSIEWKESTYSNPSTIRNYGTIIGGPNGTELSNLYSYSKIDVSVWKANTTGTGTSTAAYYGNTALDVTGVTYPASKDALYGAGASKLAFSLADRQTANATTGETETAYWEATGEDTLPIPETLVEKLRPDTTWYALPDASGNYHIDTAAELYGLAQIVNGGTDTFAGKTVYLDADIDLNPDWVASINEETGNLSGSEPVNQWTAIGTSTNKFQGTFDGNGNSIKGVYLVSSNTHAGLFGYVGSYVSSKAVGAVKNLQLTNSYLRCDAASTEILAGSIVGVFEGDVISNVYSNAYVIAAASESMYIEVGGIVGRVNGSGNHNLDTCWFDGTVIQVEEIGKASKVGGVVGSNNAGSNNYIKNCFNSGKVLNYFDKTSASGSENRNNNISTGGIVGYSKSSGTLTIENCLNIGEVYAKNHVWSVARSERGVGPIVGALGGNTVIRDTIWLNLAHLDGKEADDSWYGYTGADSYVQAGDGLKQYADLDALRMAISQGDAAALVLGFGDNGEWISLKVQEGNSTIKDVSPILKDFKTWWLTFKNYTEN